MTLLTTSVDPRARAFAENPAHMDAAIATISDAAGKRIWANSRMAELTGRSMQELVEQDVSLFPPDAALGEAEKRPDAYRDKEVQLRRADGPADVGELADRLHAGQRRRDRR